MKSTIKASWAEAKSKGITPADVIQIRELSHYGFDVGIINSMVEFDIFPQAFLIVGETYVLRAEIFGAVNRLLKNSMLIYRDVEKAEKTATEFAEMLDREKVKLDPEDIERMRSGEIALPDLLAEKKAAQPELIEAENG